VMSYTADNMISNKVYFFSRKIVRVSTVDSASL
jgi:hypothetical protein